MNKQLTRNDLRDLPVVKVRYQQLSEFLNTPYCEKIGHNAGVYGWNYDVYLIKNLGGFPICYIVTGYRMMISGIAFDDLNIKFQERTEHDWIAPLRFISQLHKVVTKREG